MNAENSKARSPVFRIEHAEDVSKPKRMQWCKTHDEYLNSLAKLNKGHNWGEIAKAMCERFTETQFTSKKCRARWKNCINPEINKVYLNDAEELLLIAHHSTYKNKWSKISKRLPHRNSNILRNSFYSAMRKTIQHIVLGRKPPQDVYPLLFVQALYITIFISELLDLPQTPAHKNPLVPLYIYLYVKEKKIDKVMCVKYVDQIKERLLSAHGSRKTLQTLKEYSYDQLATQFFAKLTTIIKQNVGQQSVLTDEVILDLLERALALNIPATPQPVPTSSPSPVPQFPLMQTRQPMRIMPGMMMNSDGMTQASPQMMVGPPFAPQSPMQPLYQIQFGRIIPVFPQSYPMPSGPFACAVRSPMFPATDGAAPCRDNQY